MQASNIENGHNVHDNDLPVATVVTTTESPTSYESVTSGPTLSSWAEYDTFYSVIVNPGRGSALYIDNVAVLSTDSHSNYSSESSVSGKYRAIELIAALISICMALGMGIFLYILISKKNQHSPSPPISSTCTEDTINDCQPQHLSNTSQPSLAPIISSTFSIIPTKRPYPDSSQLQPSVSPSMNSFLSSSSPSTSTTQNISPFPSTNSPTFSKPGEVQYYWKQISQDFPNYHSSVSLSFSGNIMAVSGVLGIEVFIEDQSTGIWAQYGGNIISKEYLEALDTKWEDMIKYSNFIKSDVTLSDGGDSLLWYIAYKQNMNSKGRAILFELPKRDIFNEWKQKGDVLNIEHIPASENNHLKDDFGPIVAFARVNGKRVLIPEPNQASVYEMRADDTWERLGKEILEDDPIEVLAGAMVEVGKEFIPEVLNDLTDFSDDKPLENAADLILFEPLFAASVGINGTGEKVVIASPHAGAFGDNKDAGKVKAHQFQREQGEWEQIGPDLWGSGVSNNFGTISFSNSGHRLVVGTTNKYTQKNGKVHVYGFNEALNNWIEISQIEDENDKKNFGQMLSLSPNGNVLAVVAPKAGRICIYDVRLSEPTKLGPCIEEGSPRARYEQYSISLSESGTRLAIGTPLASAKVYELKAK